MGRKKIILYGCGKIGQLTVQRIGYDKVEGYADSSRQKVHTWIEGKYVYSLEDLIEVKDTISIIISVGRQYYGEVYDKLCAAGLKKQIFQRKNIVVEEGAYLGFDVKYKGKNYICSGADVRNCRLGFATYISTNTILHDVSVGHYTSIGPNIRVISGQHPSHTFVSTHPGFYAINHMIGWSYVADQKFGGEHRYAGKGYAVVIGNDCWIGDGARLMEGVRIADGSIVAAGALVTRDTKPYEIVGGIPARTIRFRFDEEERDFLMKLKWWHRGKVWIRKNAGYFSDITEFKKKCKGEYNEQG